MRRRRWGWWLVPATVLLVGIAAVAVAWFRRTAPPWPTVAGVPYEIALGPDGCPLVPPRQPSFVDTPGALVRPGATEAVLCTVPASVGATPPTAGGPQPPRIRVLRDDVAGFVAYLNALPDRNTAWRDWQRRYSGWWPDPAPAPMGEVCLTETSADTHSLVLRYPDGPPVPLLITCGGVASGTRTRFDLAQPHVVDEFIRRAGD